MNSRYALSKKLLFFCILCVIECAAAAKLAAERLLWYDPLGNLSVMPPLWFVCTLFITAAFIDLLPIYVLHWVSITSSTAYWSSLSLASLPSWSTNIVMARFAFFFFLPAGQLALLMKVFDCFVWWAFATAGVWTLLHGCCCGIDSCFTMCTTAQWWPRRALAMPLGVFVGKQEMSSRGCLHLFCTSEFVATTEAMTMHMKNWNLAGTYGIYCYTTDFVAELFDCSLGFCILASL